MMQYVKASPQRVASQERVGQNLANVLGNYMHQQAADKAIGGLESDPEYQKAPFSQRASRLQQALQPLGEYGQQIYQQRAPIEQQRAQEMQQGLLFKAMHGEPLTQEEQAMIPAPMQIKLEQLRQQQEVDQNKINTKHLSSGAFTKGYSAILSGNNEQLKSVIEDPNVPLQVKTQLSNIQNQISTRHDVKNREVRNRQQLVQSTYSKAIAAERAKIGKFEYRKETDQVKKRITELESLKQKDMKKLLKDPDSYSALSIWDEPATQSFLPEEAAEEEKEDFLDEESEAQEKVKFDPKNPKHVMRAKQVLASVNGDKAKANAILSKEFER